MTRATTTPSAHHPFRSADTRARFLAHYDGRAASWPVPSTERLVETSHGPTFVRVSGELGAPPVVLLPGLGATSLMWSANVAALAARFAVYAVDNVYDHGRSTNTQPFRRSADFVGWLDALLDGLEIRESVSFVGASYGSWLATRYALRAPSRVRRLALVAPAGTILPLSAGFIVRGLLCMLPGRRRFMRNLSDWLAEVLIRRDEEGRRHVDELFEDGLRRRTSRPALATHEPSRRDRDRPGRGPRGVPLEGRVGQRAHRALPGRRRLSGTINRTRA